MKTIELKQYTSENKTQSVYVVTDGEKYMCDSDYGYVEFFNTEQEASLAILKFEQYTFAKPFAQYSDQDLYIFETGYHKIGIYNSNMNCLVESTDIYPLLNWIDENECHDKFMIFTFSKESDDDDYSPDDYYDIPPNYYDPRYDGPMHYIPPGNH